MKLFKADIDMEYAKTLDETAFKKEFARIFGVNIGEAWEFVKKQKPKKDAKSDQ